jgi:hypothetical protein
MGMDTVEVSVVCLDEAHEKALNVALNKIDGAWDNDALATLIRELAACDMSFLTGYDEVDIEALLGEKPSRDKGAQDDGDLPVISGPGDIWKLGPHRLMCGDSCNPAHIDLLMAGQQARLVLTDPPYNVAYEAKVQDQATQSGRRATSRIENDSMEDEAFRAFLLDAYRQMYRAMAPGAAHATKRWPDEAWTVLARRVAATGADVALLGGPGDVEHSQTIAERAGVIVASMAGILGLQETGAVIRRAEVLVSGDTGLMHMATGVGTPVVALFGPTVRQFGFFPYNAEHSTVVVLELACRPCSAQGGRACPLGHHRCLRAIAPEDVFERLCEALG